MTHKCRAAITGMGLITPAGVGRAASWNNVLQGRATTRRVPALEGIPIDFAGTAPDSFDTIKVSRRYDRTTQLALVAARAALADANLTDTVRGNARVGIVIGTAFGGLSTVEDNHRRLLSGGSSAVAARFLPRGMVNMTSGVLSIELGITGPSMIVSTACASGTTAIGMALTLLRGDICDIVVTGGADASVTPLCVSGFHKLNALSRPKERDVEEASRPFDVDADGFVLAEGASILVLEREVDAVARRARAYAYVAGYGSISDAHHVTAPHPEQRGQTEAMLLACRDAGVSPDDIGHVNAHATSTPTGDAAEARAIWDVTPAAVVTSNKGSIGHTQGACGAIEAALTALSLRNQTVPPVANLATPRPEASKLDLVMGSARPTRFDVALSNSLGFGGHNASLVLTA